MPEALRKGALALILGVILGWSFLAYGQPAEPPVIPSGDSQMAALAYLVQSFGLPGVLAYLGFMLRGGVPLVHTHTLSEDDRNILRSLRPKE